MDNSVDRVYIGGSYINSSLGHSLLDSMEGLEQYTPIQRLVIHSLNEVQSQSNIPLSGTRTAIIISTTKGDIGLLSSDFNGCYLWQIALSVREHFGCHTTPKVISTACISGVAATVYATRMVEDGEADSVYVVGADLSSDFIVEGFNSFKSVSATLCRPYDISRDGITIGQGCGVLLLTNDPQKSESKITIAGCGLSNDANHISGPSRDGSGLYQAMDIAMRDAGISSKDIDYVNLHGTGTLFNDDMESRAMELAGLSQTPCNSLKPYIGHTFGASGVIELVMVIEQMLSGEVYGVKGFKELGTPCELNISAQNRKVDINCALKSASGFGGTNAAIVLTKVPVTKARPLRHVVEEVAHIEIDSKDIDIPFSEYIKGEYRELGDANLKFFKMDALSKLGYVASCKLLQEIELDTPSQRVAILLANSSSSLDTDIKHQAIVDQRLPEGASPAVFVYTLPNIVAGEIAIKHKFKGELIFFVEESKDLDSLRKFAHKIIERGECDAVLYGWCELLNDNYNTELKLIKKI